MVDLAREEDAEQLRRIARTQQVKTTHPLEVLRSRCATFDEFRGRDDDLQTTLALLEGMHARELKAMGLAPATERKKKSRTKQSAHGTSERTELERVARTYELDEPDRVCPLCGGESKMLDGQGERSEMVDVVEDRCQLVDVARQADGRNPGGTGRGRRHLGFADRSRRSPEVLRTIDSCHTWGGPSSQGSRTTTRFRCGQTS